MYTIYTATLIALVHCLVLYSSAWRQFFKLAQEELPYYALGGSASLLVASVSIAANLGICLPKKVIEIERLALISVEASSVIVKRSDGDPFVPTEQSYFEKAVRVKGLSADGSAFDMTLLQDRNLIIVEEDFADMYLKKGLLKLDEAHSLADWALFSERPVFVIHVPRGSFKQNDSH